MNKSDIDLRKEWEHLPTQELETMLQAELQKMPPDDDIVLELLHILEAREPKDLPELTAREKEAFERYKQKRTAHRKKPIALTRWLSLVACLILVLGLLFNVLPQKAQAETFWEMLQRLSNTVISFFSREDRFKDPEYIFTTQNSGLQQVYDATVELGVTDPVVPMWLPEEAVLTELKNSEMPMANCLLASFTCGDGEIIYKIICYSNEPAHQYYRDDSHYESYELEGTTFNITRNNDRWSVIWTKDNIECLLTLDCQEDTLRSILKSIYVMEE